MASLTWAIILAALGIAVIIVELFIPSAGLLGIVAGILLVSGIISAFLHSLEAGAALLLLLVLLLPIMFVALVKVWPSTPIGRRILLGRMRAEEVVLTGEHYDGLKELIGETGVAKTKMLPSGGEQTYFRQNISVFPRLSVCYCISRKSVLQQLQYVLYSRYAAASFRQIQTRSKIIGEF